MAKAAATYKLSRELVGHGDDVLSLDVFKDGSIVSASRDRTARLWRANEGKYDESVSMRGHHDSVYSVCVVEPTSRNPKGFIVTGSRDKNICIYYPGEEQPIHTFKAHETTVNGLRASVVETETFLSCSSDNTGKLWNLYDLEEPKAIYSGHSSTVWCITDLQNGSVVTGGSDKIVIVYKMNGRVSHRLEGHKSCIRDISAINEQEFLTCGNDAVTKHWHSVSGLCLGTYGGHSNYIYSVSAALGGALAASCGEDRTLRVWRGGQIDQTITLPAQSVWSVRILPNEDLVCGTSDGVVRIFSTVPQRHIKNDALMKFEEAVLKSIESLAEKNKENVDIHDIPLSSELNQPGEKDGDSLIVNDKGKVKAYRWSQRQFQWVLLGDVVEDESSAQGQSGKQIYNGIEYDHVFSVDIEEGAPLLKLPYNKGQDPYMAAQKFIDDNNLNPRHLNRVANFILTNLQITPILNAESQFSDPFTGRSRYISNSMPQVPRPSTSFQSTSVPHSVDENSYIPQTYYLKLEQGNVSAIHEKLKEFNGMNGKGIQSISTEKLEALVKLINPGDSRSIEEHVNDLKSLLNWPDEMVFPVLDVARLAVLQKDVNEQFCSNGILSVIKKYVHKDAMVTNQMLTFRLLTNLFHHEVGEKFCIQCREELLTALNDISEFGNKSYEIAVSTYILNLVVALNKVNDTVGKVQVLSVIYKLLDVLKETEAVFRVLVALGTIIVEAPNADERAGFVKSVMQTRSVLKALKILLEGVDPSNPNPNVPTKLLKVTRQILLLIKR